MYCKLSDMALAEERPELDEFHEIWAVLYKHKAKKGIMYVQFIV